MVLDPASHLKARARAGGCASQAGGDGCDCDGGTRSLRWELAEGENHYSSGGL